MAYREVLEALTKPGRALIVTHRNADLDALASAVLVSSALQALGKDHCIGFPEGVSRISRNALETLGIEVSVCTGSVEAPIAIAVDASNGVMLGSYYEPYKRSAERVLIDHHEPGELASLATAKILEPEAASTSELVVEVLSNLKTRPEPKVATLGLAGIIYDSRRYAHAIPRTFSSSMKLLEWGADYQAALALALPRGETGRGEAHDFSERMAIVKAASRMKVERACSLIITVSHIGSFESSAARSLLRLGADVAGIVAPREPHSRVSVRVSKRAMEKGVEASWIAEYIASRLGGQGGGHKAAAMAHIASRPPEDIVEEIARSLPGKIARRCKEAGGEG